MSMHKILFLPAVIGAAGCVRESQMMCGVGGMDNTILSFVTVIAESKLTYHK